MTSPQNAATISKEIMDEEFWNDPARQIRAQIMLQQMYKIMHDRIDSEQGEAMSKSKVTGQSVDAGLTEEPEDILGDNESIESAPDRTHESFQTTPKATSKMPSTSLENRRRLVQRNHHPDETLNFMHDVHQLSKHHPFSFVNASHKLVELLMSRASWMDLTEAVRIQREILQIDGPDAEATHMARLVEVLDLVFKRTSNLPILEEQISLARQLVLLDPGNSRKIHKLLFLILEHYERTSNSELWYEAQALRDELRQRKDIGASCTVLSAMESEFKEQGTLGDTELWIAQHMSLVHTSPTSHVTCSERLIALSEEMRAKGSKFEDLMVVGREALGLVHRGIGISNQLKVLNALRLFLIPANPNHDPGLLLALIKRIYSLLSPSEHRVSELSWLNNHPPSANSNLHRQGSTDWHSAALAFDAIAQIEVERIPGLQWVNPMLAMHNDRARPPELMEDYQDFFRRQATQYGNFEEMPEKSPQTAQSLTMHAAAVLANNDPDQVDMVIAMLRDAVRSWDIPLDQPLPPHHPARRTVGFLGHAFYMRHWYFGEAEDIEVSVKVMRWCLAGATAESDYLRHIGPISAALEAQYRRLGNVKDIEDAAALSHFFLTKIPQVENIQIIALRSAGKAMDCLFDAIGGIEVLDQAASQVRKALRLASMEHPLMASLMSILGSILRKRFMHLLIPSDLIVSEQLTGGAVRLQEDTGGDRHQDLPHSQALFGETLLVKFEQDRQRENVDRALFIFELVLQNGKDTDADHADANYHFGNALRIRNQGDDITNAVYHLKKALMVQPDTRDPVSISEALRHSELATSLVNNKNTIRADVYAQLGEVQYAIFSLNQRAENLESCLLAFEIAASSPSSPRPRCLRYTRRWEDIALKHGHSSLWGALDANLSHQTKLAGIGQTIKARHDYLAKNPVPASRAAAHAIQQGNLERAVEYLEHGRSILWRQTLELRSSLESLHHASPSLADQLSAVVEEINSHASIQSVSSYSSTARGIEDPDRILRYDRELASQYESILSQIRQLEGFADFLRPFRFSDTAGIATEGPVIIINLCDEGCDAILIIESGIYHVPLPADFDELVIARKNLTNAGTRVMYDHGSEMDSILPPVLRLLWSSIVDPVLDFLKSHGSVPKRVFWCISGLSDLPVHAAGLYKSGSVNLPDILVSSYTPTISALIRARQAKAKSSGSRPRLLAVVQPETRGFSPLPHAIEEVSAMKKLEIVTTELQGDKASWHSVETHMQTHDWVHLCCHGTTNAQIPLLSAFHLHNGSLSIESLMRTELPLADFAFLSACHSAEGSMVQNESMSLASSMQVAGFRSIVATMYAIGDEEGPIVAHTIYEYLFNDSTGVVDSSKAAFGLNKAIRVLRKAKVPMHRWVSENRVFHAQKAHKKSQ